MDKSAIPENVRVLPISELVSISPHGDLDFEKTKTIFGEMVFAKDSPDDVIVDLRQADWSEISDAQLFNLIEFCLEHHRAYRKKLVFIEKEEVFKRRGTHFDAIANSRGLHLATVFSFEDAIYRLQAM